MDIEERLRALESRYRRTLSASIAAKANYLALLDERNSPSDVVRRARQQWETLESRKREIAARMGEVGDLEHHLAD